MKSIVYLRGIPNPLVVDLPFEKAPTLWGQGYVLVESCGHPCWIQRDDVVAICKAPA